jgi:hypothetical protein
VNDYVEIDKKNEINGKRCNHFRLPSALAGRTQSVVASVDDDAAKMRRAAPLIAEPPFAWSAAGSAAHEAFIGEEDYR